MDLLGKLSAYFTTDERGRAHPIDPLPLADAGFDRATFLARYVNKQAPAIGDGDIIAASRRLNVPPEHIKAVMTVESAGKSFDPKGRPVILFEPHVFHKRTRGKYGNTAFSYPRWREKPYPQSFDGRWSQMADAAAKDEVAALESASWGLFQIMGFHWEALGYSSVQQFTQSMVASEGGHLEALARFIEANKLAKALAACRPGDPESCRAFCKAYNGAGYASHNYHVKLARALA